MIFGRSFLSACVLTINMTKRSMATQRMRSLESYEIMMHNFDFK